MLRWRWLVLLLLPLMLITASADSSWAARRKKVDWTSVEVRPGDDAKRVAKGLRRSLSKASKGEKWGKNKLKLRARVTKLDWEQREDVVRVSLTVVARIDGGPKARSHIRLGGRPSERRKLERDALRIVANGLVTRLAELARARAQADSED